MMSTIILVDTVCTDRDLADEVTRAKLERTGVKEAERDVHRQRALDDFLDALLRRTPPITESAITSPTELGRGVMYRALERIFLLARAIDGDTWDAIHTEYRRQATAQFARSITINEGLRAPSGSSFRMGRS